MQSALAPDTSGSNTLGRLPSQRPAEAHICHAYVSKYIRVKIHTCQNTYVSNPWRTQSHTVAHAARARPQPRARTEPHTRCTQPACTIRSAGVLAHHKHPSRSLTTSMHACARAERCAHVLSAVRVHGGMHACARAERCARAWRQRRGRTARHDTPTPTFVVRMHACGQRRSRTARHDTPASFVVRTHACGQRRGRTARHDTPTSFVATMPRATTLPISAAQSTTTHTPAQ